MKTTPPPPYVGSAPPPKSNSFWSRPKVGITGLIVGLVLGAAGTGAVHDDGELEASVRTVTTLKSDLTTASSDLAQLQDDNDQLQRELALAEAGSQAAIESARAEAAAAQKQAVRAAVKEVRREARQKTKQAVASALAAVPAAPRNPQPLASTGDSSGSTDPQFGACYEANNAGFGNYVRGRDPEYDWYDDRDGDGVVCEF